MPRKFTDTAHDGQNSDPGEEPVDATATGVENQDPTHTSSTETQSQLELERLKAERDQAIDRLARLQAEFENARKREARERTDFRDFAVSGAVEQFLPVLDNFRLSLGSSASVEQLRAGIELILKQMDEALRGLNVQPVETVGTQFDPRIHEALGSIETVEHPDHQVLEEIRRGYKLRDKLLRPALVRIATNSAQTSE